jgi:hypothetical protein
VVSSIHGCDPQYNSLSTASTALAIIEMLVVCGFDFRTNSSAHFALTIRLTASLVWGSGRSNKPVSQYEVPDKGGVKHPDIYRASFQRHLPSDELMSVPVPMHRNEYKRSNPQRILTQLSYMFWLPKRIHRQAAQNHRNCVKNFNFL